MKRILTAVFILTVCFAVVGFGQSTSWQFVKVFPDTTITFAAGVHGLSVDPDGKIWVGPAGVTNNDSLPNGKKTVSIYVYNPNGSEAAISRIKIINTTGASDTLTALCRGSRTDMDGNIVYTVGANIWRLNYKTGVGMAKVIPTAATSTIAPAFTSANEMFTGHVAPGNPVKIWASDFSTLGTVFASSQGYSRTIEVTKDGNNIFWCGYTTSKVYVYHSDLGTLGTYALADSFGTGMMVESSAWNKKDGYLYLSSGNIDTVNYAPGVQAPWRPTVWYAFNTTTKAVKDSIVWNWAAYPYSTSDVTFAPRPRAIDFSVSGDTAYVACFNHGKAAIQMFRRVVTSVEQVESGIPSGYTLSQNFPNPFNPSTEIHFTVAKGGLTTLVVYDMLGREVATLVNENLAPGTYKSKFDASKLSSGSYIYTLTSGTFRMSQKMLLLK